MPRLSSAKIEAEARKLYRLMHRVRIDDLPAGVTAEQARQFVQDLATKPSASKVFDRDVSMHARMRAVMGGHSSVEEEAEHLLARFIRGAFGAWLEARGLVSRDQFMLVVRNQIRISWQTPIEKEAS